jgi:hypothetical protein
MSKKRFYIFRRAGRRAQDSHRNKDRDWSRRRHRFLQCASFLWLLTLPRLQIAHHPFPRNLTPLTVAT